MVPMTVKANAGARRKLRTAYRTSCHTVSMNPIPRASRHLVGDEGRRSESDAREALRVGVADAGVPMFSRLHLEMERQLLVELVIDAPPEQERAEPQHQIGDCHVTPA